MSLSFGGFGNLPDIGARVVVDDSQLKKVSGTASKTGEAIAAGMSKGTTHTLRFEQSLTTMLDHFGGMPPVVNEASRSLKSILSQGVKNSTLMAGCLLAVSG